MKILIVNGKARSGKDSFCEYAHDNHGLVYPISTVDRVKQVALFAGWSGEKDERGRKFLSDLKDAMSEYGDLPRNYVLDWMRQRLNTSENSMIGTDDVIFLVHAREPADIKRWVEENGARALLIHRPEAEKSWGNHADDEVENYDYHYYLTNDGTLEEWEKKSVDFIDRIRKENWESKI